MCAPTTRVKIARKWRVHCRRLISLRARGTSACESRRLASTVRPCLGAEGRSWSLSDPLSWPPRMSPVGSGGVQAVRCTDGCRCANGTWRGPESRQLACGAGGLPRGQGFCSRAGAEARPRATRGMLPFQPACRPCGTAVPEPQRRIACVAETLIAPGAACGCDSLEPPQIPGSGCLAALLSSTAFAAPPTPFPLASASRTHLFHQVAD